MNGAFLKFFDYCLFVLFSFDLIIFSDFLQSS